MSNFYVDEAKQLIGKKIVNVVALPKSTQESFMWYGRSADSAIAIIFDDGTVVIPMQDDEGNGAGVLMYATPEEKTQVTTMRAEMFAS
jgi:hypothetical protein